ncbi:MAG TPA: enoyl-CoA hydratase/isomerase family protein, partial [Acidimicrobiales bacterium]|nr:enoyl-CoA hydratase/isomerase family protein [Acidimicrobiales bacterium]
MERETILFDVADNVATITLNRPDAMNAFNDAMAEDMAWAWETVRDTAEIHCVVIQANGERAFCTGIDVSSEIPWFMKENTWNTFDPGETLGPKLRHKVWKPVVTAVHGLCAGGAQYFLNESDIIICSDDAVFFDPHANVGIVSALEPIGMLHRGVPLGDVLR